MNQLTRSLAMAATVAGVIWSAVPAEATPVGDPIDHETSLFHGPVGDLFATGPGAPVATLFLGTPAGGTRDLVADFTTGTALGWNFIRIDIAGGFDGTTQTATLPTSLPATSVLTHDIEDLASPGSLPTGVVVWGSNFSQPPGLGLAQQAYGGFIQNNSTLHDVDGSTFGFDLGIEIALPGLLLTPPVNPPANEFYVIAFTFNPSGPGVPPPLFPDTEIIATIVPEPGVGLLVWPGLAGIIWAGRLRSRSRRD